MAALTTTRVTVTRQESTHNIGTVSSQWANRPRDQRFATYEDWSASAVRQQRAAISSVVQVRDLALRAVPGVVESGQLTDPGSIYMLGRKPERSDAFGASGDAARARAYFTHAAFGQVCSLAGAPASYIRTLPAELALPALQWGLATAGATAYGGSGEAKFYGYRVAADGSGTPDSSGTGIVAAAFTGPGYGRIYDAQVIAMCGEVIRRSGGAWGIPDGRVALPGQAEYFASADPLETTTLYRSDHDCFGFFVDASHPIEVPGMGERGVLYRGFFVWNSETGDKTFGISTFEFRACCRNRNIYDARDQTTLRIRHTSGGPGRFATDAVPALNSYATSGTAGRVAQIQAAAAKQVAKDHGSAVEWLRAQGFTAAQATGAATAAEREEGSAGSVWDLVNGVTAFARGIDFQDDRVALERKAGALLASVGR